MNYNERLADIISRTDDDTYRMTAETIRESKVDFVDHYQKHNKRVPLISGVNTNVVKKAIEQLLKEENANKKKNLTSLVLI